MDHNNSDELKDASGEPGDVTHTHTHKSNDQENPESFCPEKEQRRCNPCTVAEDLSANGPWSQRSISRSLQRAETLFRSTFNPSLRWLFHGRSQDEEEVEGNFVVAHNLVSRSSARLLRLQQVLLRVASQWQLIGSTQVGSPQVCVKGLPAEGGVLLLQEHYVALWRLLEQRSLLLLMHEYSRRAHLAAAFTSRVSHLLEDQLRPQRTLQTLSSWSPPRVGLCSLSQELRVHLNHWSCLFSKVQSDHYLRPALVQQTQLLKEIKQTLDLLGLEALVLMERYVCVLLSSVAQTNLDSVPKEVLEDILAGADLYNQAVGEQRAHQSATQLRTSVLQQAHYSTLDSGLPTSRGWHPGGLSVKELMMILAVHQADVAAKQLHCWASEQSHHICQVHPDQDDPSAHDGTSAWRPEWSWEQLQHTYLMSSPHTSPDLCSDRTIFENYRPVLVKPPSVQHRPEGSNRDQTSQCQTYLPQPGLTQTSVEALHSFQPTLDRQKLLQTGPPPSPTVRPLSALPLSGVRQRDHSSIELLFQVLVSSSDRLSPLVSHTPAPEAPAKHLLPNTTTGKVSPQAADTDDSVGWTNVSTEPNKDQHVEGAQQEGAEVETPTRLEAPDSSGFGGDGNPEKEEPGVAEETTEEPGGVRWPHSVQWLDLGQSLVFADVFGQYRSLLWTFCSRALWLQLHVPQAGNTTGSIGLQDKHRAFQILHRISQASKTALVPEEGRTMLEDFSVNLFVTTAHAQWDHVLCRSLGSALKDKCLPAENEASSSVTMENFLLLSPPLLSSLCCRHSDSRMSASFSLFPSRLTLQRQTVSLALATVQMSTVWVMSKAYQFLSSWNLNKFLLITQGDLKVLRGSLEMMVHQTKSLVMNFDVNQHLHIHNQLLLRQQLRALDLAVSELQTFSSLVLKTFSRDCKRMSGEIFEQTMPPAVHWRPSLKTGFPSSPSEYASQAAQTVIGQVLEGVAPLSDDARVQALSITMTAFMEAWMEHILRQKIKFSVQGALQLKQDFDSIRELIQSDRYGLSADLHQHLLGLRVFQQVDSAVVCLLQQPQVKPYLQPRAWESFTRCCPASSSRGSVDAAVGSSITNLRSMEGEDLTPSDPSVVTPTSPGEPYLAPSLALGVAQREWLDLRIHSNARRWRLPGLQCLSKSEP